MVSAATWQPVYTQPIQLDGFAPGAVGVSMFAAPPQEQDEVTLSPQPVGPQFPYALHYQAETSAAITEFAAEIVPDQWYPQYPSIVRGPPPIIEGGAVAPVGDPTPRDEGWRPSFPDFVPGPEPMRPVGGAFLPGKFDEPPSPAVDQWYPSYPDPQAIPFVQPQITEFLTPPQEQDEIVLTQSPGPQFPYAMMYQSQTFVPVVVAAPTVDQWYPVYPDIIPVLEMRLHGVTVWTPEVVHWGFEGPGPMPETQVQIQGASTNFEHEPNPPTVFYPVYPDIIPVPEVRDPGWNVTPERPDAPPPSVNYRQPSFPDMVPGPQPVDPGWYTSPVLFADEPPEDLPWSPVYPDMVPGLPREAGWFASPVAFADEPPVDYQAPVYPAIVPVDEVREPGWYTSPVLFADEPPVDYRAPIFPAIVPVAELRPHGFEVTTIGDVTPAPMGWFVQQPDPDQSPALWRIEGGAVDPTRFAPPPAGADETWYPVYPDIIPVLELRPHGGTVEPYGDVAASPLWFPVYPDADQSPSLWRIEGGSTEAWSGTEAATAGQGQWYPSYPDPDQSPAMWRPEGGSVDPVRFFTPPASSFDVQKVGIYVPGAILDGVFVPGAIRDGVYVPGGIAHGVDT